jgi:hypothetical protein
MCSLGYIFEPMGGFVNAPTPGTKRGLKGCDRGGAGFGVSGRGGAGRALPQLCCLKKNTFTIHFKKILVGYKSLFRVQKVFGL